MGEQVREFRRKETITANPARYKVTKRVQHESCCWTDRCRCTCRAAHSASGDGAVRRHRPVRQGPRARRDLCVQSRDELYALASYRAQPGVLPGSPQCWRELLLRDKCACEEKPITFVQSRLDKVGMKIEDWIDFGKEVVSGMGCDSAQDLQVYPACTKP